MRQPSFVLYYENSFKQLQLENVSAVWFVLFFINDSCDTAYGACGFCL